MRKKKKLLWIKVGIITGLLLALLSWIIYSYYNIGWIGSIHQEIAGGGIIILVVSIVYYFKNIKLT